jgi:cell pole-organizing protein PopZ
MVSDDGTVVDVKDEAPAFVSEPVAAPAAPAPPSFFETPSPEPSQPPAMDKEAADALLSDVAETAAASSLAALASTVHVEKKAAFTGFTPLGNGNKTIEDIVMELMKPMLKEWLDQNLPPVVERIVQKEVERIARRVQE